MDIPLLTTASISPTTSGPAINSPSNLSYSSGPSHTSTRSTSPDSASSGPFSRRLSPLVDLGVTTTSIEHTPNTLFDSNSNMDKNSFQSVNDRRNKLASERLTGNQFQHAPQQQQQQQPQPPHQHLASPQTQAARPSAPAPPSHHRNLASANWRAHTAEDALFSQPRTMYNPFDVTPTHHLQHPSARPSPFHNARIDQYQNLQTNSVLSYPNFGPTSDVQLDSSFAYCYDRGNGQYTRLIPADMLPPLHNIPALQHNCSGMVVVPQPRGVPPNGHSSNTEPVALRSAPSTPTSSADTIQSRIDNIVAATPPTPVHLPGHAGGGPSSSHNAPPGHRRVKVYCDKWVHEGVCAFTQQGCKYKHEMPTDKVTQHTLGLFHGYPQWWKKHQADLARQREAPPSEALKDCSPSNDSRSNNERYIGRINASAPGSGGTRGGGLGLASDAGGQLAWRHSGEYSGDTQILGTPSTIGRTSTSRGICGSARNAMASRTPDNNLSPCPPSYGSPFGPIAPPVRGNATTGISGEGIRGPSGVQPSIESRVMTQGTRRSSPAGPSITTSSMLPTSNPYASLDSLEDCGDQNTSEGATYTEAPRLGGARLS
ncbi:hypothetical protein F4803DRAFT_568764 [Xylaria telfairii]|nr:hypothetical protein F4803DRAFT_568764 [Xylaria telfairii]